MRNGTWFISLLFVVLWVSACSRPAINNANYDILAARQIKCPEGARLEFRPWGESGLMAICQLEHGPVVMAEGGRIAIEGENFMGTPSGERKWFDSAGKIIRSEKYPSKRGRADEAKP